jgi:hypothetical protein
MKPIVRIKFGSHLYGTATPQSDIDLKGVFLPSARDILLQRVKGSVSTKRAKAEGEKNFAGEIDEESYSLQRFLGLVAEGQTVALDMLFAPDWALEAVPAREWLAIRAATPRLLTRKSASFIGYCRQQANKYGIKGSRVAAARKALDFLTAALEEHGTVVKLGVVGDAVSAMAAETEHMAMIDVPQVSGATIPHLDVCGRKMPFTATIKLAHGIMEALVREYGHRALKAEAQQGVDWKALSHAVRVGRQAIELLTTARVTFPLPDAAHILDIKLGRIPYQEVAADIEQLLVDVEAAAERSSLPDEPDHAWIADFVAEAHRKVVLA